MGGIKGSTVLLSASLACSAAMHCITAYAIAPTPTPPNPPHPPTQPHRPPTPAAYMRQAPGAGNANATASAAAAAGSGAAAEPDDSAIRDGLRRAAAGKCTIKFGCPCASNGCPFQLEVRRPAGSATADVIQTCSHQFHDPASAAERGKLKPHPALEGIAALLLKGGVKPAAVATVAGSVALAPGDPLGLGIPSGSLGAAHFANGRVSLTRQQVTALKKRVGRASGFGVSSDAQAVAAYVTELKEAGCLGAYQPYKAACGQGRGRTPEQPIIVVTQTPFQKRMLAAFGRRMVFMDTTFGVTRYGYGLTAMTVRAGGGPAMHAAAAQAGVGRRMLPTQPYNPHLTHHPSSRITPPSLPGAGAGRVWLLRARGVHAGQRGDGGGVRAVPADAPGGGEPGGGWRGRDVNDLSERAAAPQAGGSTAHAMGSTAGTSSNHRRHAPWGHASTAANRPCPALAPAPPPPPPRRRGRWTAPSSTTP